MPGEQVQAQAALAPSPSPCCMIAMITVPMMGTLNLPVVGSVVVV